MPYWERMYVLVNGHLALISRMNSLPKIGIYNHLQAKEENAEATESTPLSGSIQYHSIEYVIKNIIKPRDEVPTCSLRSNCLAKECTQWKFVE